MIEPNLIFIRFRACFISEVTGCRSSTVRNWWHAMQIQHRALGRLHPRQWLLARSSSASTRASSCSSVSAPPFQPPATLLSRLQMTWINRREWLDWLMPTFPFGSFVCFSSFSSRFHWIHWIHWKEGSGFAVLLFSCYQQRQQAKENEHQACEESHCEYLTDSEKLVKLQFYSVLYASLVQYFSRAWPVSTEETTSKYLSLDCFDFCLEFCLLRGQSCTDLPTVPRTSGENIVYCQLCKKIIRKCKIECSKRISSSCVRDNKISKN